MRVFFWLAISALGVLAYTNDRRPTVALQPYDDFDTRLTDTIASAIRDAYDMEVHVLSPRPIPSETFINIRAPRYRADQLIKKLQRQKPAGTDYILGLTDADISFTKRDEHGNIPEPWAKYADWRIYGLGYRSAPGAVVSSHRLRDDDEAKFVSRLKKIALHELGHNLGLPHCENETCLMRHAAEAIKTVDFVDMALCAECRHTLTDATGQQPGR